MKVLYVGDHRDSVNWGGRGQSIALYQILKRHFEVIGSISGTSVLSVENDDGYINTLLPQKYIRFLYRTRSKAKFIDWYLRLEEKLGAKDFVTDEPEESLQNLLRYKDKAQGLKEIYEKVKQADVLVINGEGSGIFRTPFRRDFFFYLTMVELGKHLAKEVYYVNGILSDCPQTGRNIKNFISARKTLAKCAAVLVRDPESFDLVTREMPGVTCRYVPDALFRWFPLYQKAEGVLPANGDFLIGPPEKDRYFGKLDFSRPYICIGGSASAADDQERAYHHYSGLVNWVKELGYPVYLTVNCGGDRFLERVGEKADAGIVPVNTPILMAGAVLANARLFISGRFHATIFASLGGTPCIFLGTHSHKMKSLLKTLEYENDKIFSAFPSSEDSKGILELGRDYLTQGDKLRLQIRSIVAKRCEEAGELGKFLGKNL